MFSNLFLNLEKRDLFLLTEKRKNMDGFAARIVLIITDSLMIGIALAPHPRLIRKGNERKGGRLPSLTDMSRSPETEGLIIWQISWSGLAAYYGTNAYPSSEFAHMLIEDYRMLKMSDGTVSIPDLVVFWIGMNDCRAVHMENRRIAETNALQEFDKVLKYDSVNDERCSQTWTCDLIGTGQITQEICGWIEGVRKQIAALCGRRWRATGETENIKALWVGPGTARRPTPEQRLNSPYIKAAEARKEARLRAEDVKYPGCYNYVRRPRSVGMGDPKKKLCPYSKLVGAINKQAQRRSKRFGGAGYLHPSAKNVIFRKVAYLRNVDILDHFNHIHESGRVRTGRALLRLIRETLGMPRV